MTCQVIVMNRNAVAMASDSALTIRGLDVGKIYYSTSKIYSISKNPPVGLMTHGGAIFMGIPWDTIVHEFVCSLGDAQRSNLQDYVLDFVKFIQSDSRLSSPQQQEGFVSSSVSYLFYNIYGAIFDKIELELGVRDVYRDEDTTKIVNSILQSYEDDMNQQTMIEDLPDGFADEVCSTYGTIIHQWRDHLFGKLQWFSVDHVARLDQLACKMFERVPFEETLRTTSGLVFAGFGTEDLLPSMVVMRMGGFVSGRLWYCKEAEEKLTPDSTSLVIPFAQNRAVWNFLSGMHPAYELQVERVMARQFQEFVSLMFELNPDWSEDRQSSARRIIENTAEKWIPDTIQKLRDFQVEFLTAPIHRALTHLPKDELVTIAESLVNLESLRMKMSSDPETVGGPIDVAIMSKADGFVWVKRKYPFSLDG